MIKRRFYKRGHGGGSSDSSSSSSDSDSDSVHQNEEEVELKDNQEDEDYEITVERTRSEIKKNKEEKKKNKRNKRSPSPGSGYESEDSSADVVKVDSSGFLASEEDSIEKDGESIKKANTKDAGKGASKAGDRTLNSNDAIESDFADCILRCKSVFKCRLCPRIVCLSEDSVKAHLNSKRHARSKKLLDVGRLKFMLNSDGEIEEDAETHAERHARTIALAQEPVAAPAKKDTGHRHRREILRREKVHIAGVEMEAGYPLTQPERYRAADEAVQKFYHDDRSRMHLVGQNMPFGQYYAARIPSRRPPRSRRPRDASAEPPQGRSETPPVPEPALRGEGSGSAQSSPSSSSFTTTLEQRLAVITDYYRRLETPPAWLLDTSGCTLTPEQRLFLISDYYRRGETPPPILFESL